MSDGCVLAPGYEGLLCKVSAILLVTFYTVLSGCRGPEMVYSRICTSLIWLEILIFFVFNTIHYNNSVLLSSVKVKVELVNSFGLCLKVCKGLSYC